MATTRAAARRASAAPTCTVDNDRVDTPHPAYERMRARWEKCRALMGGTDEIREGAELYLPRLVDESDEAYEFRLKLCAVFNGFKRTVKACVGLLLEKNPQLGEDMPPRLQQLWEDVDQAGTHGDVYTKQIAEDAMIDGHAGTLVDYPHIANPEKVSADDEQRMQLRAFWVRYKAEDIIKLVYAKVSGVKVIALLVLRETSEEVAGRFGVRTVTRYRVFRRTDAGITWELWRAEAAGVAVNEVEERPIRGVKQIPFSLLVAGDELGDFETRPPLENLADLNLEHHQLKTDIRNLQSLACVPTQVRIGAPKDDSGNYPPITLGPRSTIEAPYPPDGAPSVPKPVYWHTPDVSVLEPALRSLEDVKADMGAAGMAFLAPDKRAAETAEAKRIDASAQNATLSTVSRSVQDHLEEVFGFTAEYMAEKAGSVTLNREFELAVLEPAMVAAYTKAAEAGKLSIETFLKLLERGRALPEGFDHEDELRRILQEGALSPGPVEREDEG